jgi:hypothetical protein
MVVKMKNIITFIKMCFFPVLIMSPLLAKGHHSFAMFDSSQFMLVEGTVLRWNFNSPHSWLYIEALDAQGDLVEWGFEAGSPINAMRNGVTGNTFQRGERIKVVINPIRTGAASGAICFAQKEDDLIVRPNNNSTCDSVGIAARWTEEGWLENAAHLESHPAN